MTVWCLRSGCAQRKHEREQRKVLGIVVFAIDIRSNGINCRRQDGRVRASASGVEYVKHHLLGVIAFAAAAPPSVLDWLRRLTRFLALPSGEPVAVGLDQPIVESCFITRLYTVLTKRIRVTDWLTPSQQRTWLTYMRVYHRLEYEMNRQLQAEFDMSLGDYTVLNALSNSAEHRMQLTSLATLIGWERSRLSHHLLRMTKRGWVDRVQSNVDGARPTRCSPALAGRPSKLPPHATSRGCGSSSFRSQYRPGA
jgi:DNA-binding MarR family transcriptional regulator